ncbi:MAG: nodulation protein NodH [Rhodobacterales bacterium]
MAKTKFKYFVLLANMRTGSNLFEQTINLFDSFSCKGELFNPHFIGYPNQDGFCGMDVTARDRNPGQLIRKMVAQASDVMPGFRLFSDHDQRVLDYVLEDETCAKIMLTRNPLDSYISHAIAKKTDQWRLTDLHKRKIAKVDFDIIGFKSYVNTLSGFSKKIRTKLQATGQTAFQLSYTDLGRLEVFNGMSLFLESEERLDSLKEKIKKQNPESLSEKVNNYKEMLEQVRSINFLDNGLPDFHEPERHAAAKNFVLGDTVPLLFQPINEVGKSVIEDWLSAHLEANGGALLTDFKQKQVFDWLRQNHSRLVFSLLTHPVERVHHAFNKYIFQAGSGGFPWIRKILIEQYNVKMPDAGLCETLNKGVLESIGYSVEDYRLAVKKFVKFLNGNLKGQTRARIDQSWASQSAILDGYTKVVHPDYLLRAQTYQSTLEMIENSMGLAHIPVGEIVLDEAAFELAQIYDDELEQLVAKAYSRDYMSFGFKGWRT